MKSDRFIEKWQIAAKDFGLEIIVPFTLNLPSGAEIQVDILLKKFGNVNGMVIVKDWNKFKEYADEIVEEGYGFSVMYQSKREEPYVREEYLDILNDWGWTGKEDEKPDWLED